MILLNLFSIFDPSTSMFLSLNWTSMPLFLFLLIFPFWIKPSRLNYSNMLILKFIFNEFKIMTYHSFANLIIFISILYFIMFNNLISLFPYIFTVSSHLSVSLSLSMPLWISILLFISYNYFKLMMIHLTPMNTPMFLIPFMIIIELISNLIRPITLAIRLTTNMIAGHLLLSLLGTPPMFMLYFPLNILSQILLFILEIAVAFIQSYVFTTLLFLYSKEIYE